MQLFCRTSGSYVGAFQGRSFNNEDIMVTLPNGVDACDIGTITIWCQPFRAIFTRLAIPRSTFVSIAISSSWYNYCIIASIVNKSFWGQDPLYSLIPMQPWAGNETRPAISYLYR